MKNRISTIQNSLNTLTALVGAISLPKDFPSYICMLGVDPHPTITFNIDMAPNEGGREQLLALAGDLFGRTDWIKKLNYGNTHFHWIKDLQGVKITLNDAERILLPQDKIPVPPSAFPILLESPQTPSGNVQNPGQNDEASSF